MNEQRLLSDLARVRAQFQLEAIMRAMGFTCDLKELDNQHKDAVESSHDLGTNTRA